VILTLTPNPSLDLLFRVDRLVWDDANRTAPPRRRAGGQGINVARAVRALDDTADALAIAPLGGPVGRELREMLDAEGTPLMAVPIEGETRVFVGTRESETGRSLLLNPNGPTVGPEVADALLEALDSALDGAGRPAWVIGCGSLLPGLPTDMYARAGRRARARGARFIPDCDGEALGAAVAEADLLVPNDMEAGRLVGRAVRTPEEAVEAGRVLRDRGPDRVVITLGARGAVSVSGGGAWWGRPELPHELSRAAEDGSAVGAGDAFLAGLLLADGREDEAGALRRAVATGTAVLLGRGPALVRPGDVETVLPHVLVTPLDAGDRGDG
jgi:1-phosphofructokinase